ncbi:hypothetical protein LJC63_06620 [Ruminococcaceae bacterium OttesenSCG-928-L11]|nr:hypothetical protein [Ruminococcaceae bacterium OttesenSCG-928-L11]
MSNKIAHQITALIDALRTEEQEEKKRYDAAIDIEDMAEAKEVMFDARTKIQQLRKWTESLAVMQEEVSGSYLTANSIPAVRVLAAQAVIKEEPKASNIESTPPAEPETFSEDTTYSSAGEYVRQKLYQLSRSGFVFTEEQLQNMQDPIWSRKKLGLPHQFARLFDETEDILKQTSIAGRPRRYWVKDKFRFGEATLLIYSGWAPTYLPYFDRWYNSLIIQDKETQDNPISSLPTEEVTHIPKPYTLEEDLNTQAIISGAPALSEFTLFDKVYEVRNWDAVLVNVCEVMILKRPYKALSIGVKQLVQSGGAPVVWLDEFGESPEAHKLSNGLSVVKNRTSEEIISYCEHILILCGYDRSELKIG